MNPRHSCLTRPMTVGIMVMILILGITSVSAQDEGVTVADQLSKAIAYYSDLEFQKGIDLAKGLLNREGIDVRDSIAIFSVLSMLTYGQGEDHINASFGYLEKMSKLGPCAIPLPYEFWPQQLRDRWYKLMNARGSLTCPEGDNPGIKTIAIMEFDNYSVGEYQEELGFLTKGLADFFENDFAKISSLKVVERDKIDYVLKEIELSKAGMVETSTAIRVGKLLGAQIMVFGTVSQLDSRSCKMLVKAVKVETSEIIASVEREGKPDYFKMEKELVKELAANLDLSLNKETEQMLDESATESSDAATLYSKGLYYMDQYEYAKAFDFFKSAYEADNNFAEAKRKMDIYRPFAIS